MTKKKVNFVAGSTSNMSDVKFVNFVDLGGEDCELQFYGEVVKTKPRDWWTGEKVDTNFVAEDDVLKEIKKCEGKKNVTMRINSPGGDFHTGILIYNRLKELDCKKTAIIDGLAASAATIIACAADTIKMPATAKYMIHEVSAAIMGWVKSDDVDELCRSIESSNSIAAEAYAAKTGKSTKEIRKAMKKSTWLTGRQAVEEGWVDELIEDDTAMVNYVMSTDRKTLMVNGLAFNMSGFENVPDFPVMNSGNFGIQKQAQKQVVEPVLNNTNQTGVSVMEIKNCEELRTQYPAFVQEIEKNAIEAAVAAAVQKERNRIKEIAEIENQIADINLVNEAKFGNNTMTASELALSAMKANAKAGTSFLDDRQQAAQSTNSIESVPNGGTQNNTTELSIEEKINRAAQEAMKDMGV